MEMMMLVARLQHVLTKDTLVVLKLMMVQNVHMIFGYVMAIQIVQLA